ncbi:DUF3558 domain-containing protein [Nocardia panacis]|uniref:DUF3558 domain-containing protein n=1 Tax=Nocardia panacis TaxID=2340916 RepID=A0A3A4K038_9NOCA|nr:DUF3558 domain-containing protein [Nocardia panacis]RJO77175.1 DUF3558 domain-containing protein [Nocardia panacis]
MRARRGAAVVAALLAVGGTVVGCGQTVRGTPQAAGAGDSVNTKFDKLLRECEAVTLDQIAEIIGGKGSYAQSSFYGAVCMWDVLGAPGGNAMATLNWYENGSLTNEKANNDRLGYSTANVNFGESLGLETRRPNDPDSCGISAAAPDTGIVGWWINYRAGSAHPDPCASARKLVELTLNLAR